jgi:hypothetical protein
VGCRPSAHARRAAASTCSLEIGAGIVISLYEMYRLVM